MPKSSVILDRVAKSFSQGRGVHTDVIRDVSLDIGKGELVVFVGPSGCGKSTLLRLVAGLETPTSGTITIAGTDVTHVHPSKRGVAMVFQSYALYPHMTVEDNIGFALKIKGLPREQVKARVREVAEIVQLEELLHRHPKALSGGQRQRVAIGRAMVREPDVFLFDEPLSNLDAALRGQMRIEIARLHAKLGATSIYVTHDQVEAMTLADKIVVLNAGRIEQVGAPMELYRNPANLFVATFIGSPRMNILAVKLTAATRDSVTVTTPQGRLTLPRIGAVATLGSEASLGLRPEGVSLVAADEDTDPGRPVLTGYVSLIERLGGETFAYARFDDGGDVLTIAAGADRDLKAGQAYEARFNPSATLFFDAAGARIR